MHCKILIIIPSYNEADNILNTIDDIRQNCSPSFQPSILVVDDCSTDDTARILDDAHIPHLSLSCNLGIGGAVQCGYLYAFQNDYDIAIQFDGDGQHDASYLESLVHPLISNQADYTIGSRFISKEGYQSSAARRIGIRFLSSLINLLSGVRVNDVTSGLRAVNKDLICLFANQYAQDYPEPEALVLASRSGYRIREVPVKMHNRSYGNSSITPLKSVYYMIKVSLSLLLSGLFVHSRIENDKRSTRS